MQKTTYGCLSCAVILLSNLSGSAQNQKIIGPVATHAMAMVFGYVTPEQYTGTQEIEPLVINPLTGYLDNSGVVTRLADLFNQNKAYILTNTSLFQAMIKRYPKVKIENWRCKAISNFVYLFIQDALLPPENIANATSQIPDLEAIEPYLGIKISNKASISSDELRSSNFFKQPSKNLAEECANIFEAFWDGTQSKIFIPKTDYAKEVYQKMVPPPVIPTWGFLLLGFGKPSQNLTNPDGLVCGLQIPIFRKLFDFFTTQINTGIIITRSSYFADTNMVAVLREDPAGDGTKGLKKYPFTLISVPIAAAPLFGGVWVEESHQYNEFFTKLLPPPTRETWRVNWQPEANNFENVVALAIHPYHYFVGSEERKTTPAAIPVLRPAGAPFFVPAQFGGSVVVIADSLIKPGLEKQPLYTNELTTNPSKASYPSPDIILLSLSKNFTRPLVLTQRADRKLPTIMGINTGPSVYVFDEVDAHSSRISDVIDAFLRIPGLEQDQAFIIKKLHAISDLDRLVPVNRPPAEKIYFELKIVHKRPIKLGSEGQNMIVVKQFDCTKNCVEKPVYTLVAASQGDCGEKTDLKWVAIAPATADQSDPLIATISAQKIPLPLRLFAL